MRTETRSGAPLYVVTDAPGEAISDAALARALQEGRPEAPGLAWARFSSLVYGALARGLGPDEEVEDLTQEVFIRLFRRVATLEDPTALRSFVYSIAVRVMRAELRRRWVRRIMRLADAATLAETAATGPGPDDGGRDALARLYEILDRLNAQDRTLYVLRHLEGLSLEETAEAAGVSLATVKRRLAKAALRVEHHVRRDPLLQGYLSSSRQEHP